jgi:hypothetical protein
MLTKEQVLAGWARRDRGAVPLIDGRDAKRLALFFPESDWRVLGVRRVEGRLPLPPGPALIEIAPGKVHELVVEPQPERPWTREEVLAQARADLDFAFEKALD